MIQENKESRAAPRQSNTFKMLQEVLEADERGEEQAILRKIVFTHNLLSQVLMSVVLQISTCCILVLLTRYIKVSKVNL